jgi:CheY-like chemotaxis protein
MSLSNLDLLNLVPVATYLCDRTGQIRTRTLEQGGKIPAIALTAYAGELDQQQALAAGFQQHIAKPVEPEELLRAIAHLVQHPQST